MATIRQFVCPETGACKGPSRRSAEYTTCSGPADLAKISSITNHRAGGMATSIDSGSFTSAPSTRIIQQSGLNRHELCARSNKGKST